MPDLLKVKENMQRMVNGGATLSELDEYANLEGVTPDMMKNIQDKTSDTITSAPNQITQFIKQPPTLQEIKETLIGTAKDIATIPAHYVNQSGYGLPRRAVEEWGGTYPTETTSPTAQLLARGAGIAGAVMSPINKVLGIGKLATLGGKGLAQAGKLASMQGAKALGQLGASGAIANALYAPSKSQQPDYYGNMPQRAIQGAVLAPAAAVVGRTASKALGNIPKKLNSMAERTINSLISPLKNHFSYGKNPGRGVAKEGIIAKDWEDLGNKLTDRIKVRGKEINTVLKNNQSIVDISDDIDKAFSVSMKEAVSKGKDSQSLLTRLMNAREAIKYNMALDETGNIVASTPRKLTQITPYEATEIKRFIGGLTKWTGNPSDDEKVNGALVGAYREVRKKIESSVPGIKELNERESDLLSAASAYARRSFQGQKNQIISLGDMLATGLGATGGAGGAGFGLMVSKALKSTQIKTAVASSLSKTADSLDKLSNLEKQAGNRLTQFLDKRFNPQIEELTALTPEIIETLPVSKQKLLQEAVRKQIEYKGIRQLTDRTGQVRGEGFTATLPKDKSFPRKPSISGNFLEDLWKEKFGD